MIEWEWKEQDHHLKGFVGGRLIATISNLHGRWAQCIWWGPEIKKFRTWQDARDYSEKEFAEWIKSLPLTCVPEGYVIVPKEPTEAMERAAYDLIEASTIWDREAFPDPDKIWSAMIEEAEGKVG